MITEYPTQGGRAHAQSGSVPSVARTFVCLGTVVAPPQTVDPLNPQFDRVPKAATEFSCYGTTTTPVGPGNSVFYIFGGRIIS